MRAKIMKIKIEVICEISYTEDGNKNDLRNEIINCKKDIISDIEKSLNGNMFALKTIVKKVHFNEIM